ncbi:MAG TPA: DUF885 family protein [Steroidobacteraceae bacterium]|nr:DUF885 family protein [Steroidobacteraceae bacterium]
MDRRTLIFGTAAGALLAGRLQGAGATNSRGSKALDALFDRFMSENLDLSPMMTTTLGLDGGARAPQKSRLDDFSGAGIARQKTLVSTQLSRLRQFDRGSLGPGDTTSYDVVLYSLATSDAANRAFDYGTAFSTAGAGFPYVLNYHDSSFISVPALLYSDHQITDRADAEAYLARLSAFGTVLDQEIDAGRHDLAQGIVPPDFVVARSLEQIRKLRSAAPAQSPLTHSIVQRTRDRGIPGGYANAAARLVADQVYPGLDRQLALLQEMRRVATHEAGVWRLPGGDEYYQASLTSQTTTDKPAAEIHRQGLEIVREESARLDRLLRTQGLTDGTVAARSRALYEDPRFLYPNTDAGKTALIADLNHRVQSVWSKLPAWFGVVPKAPVEIRRVPAERESGESQGYYSPPSLDGKRAGVYWINLRDTAELPKWFVPTLTYHESIPGHHLQGSIQLEAGLPLIRKIAFFDAYVEGWALYAEALATEMGEYASDPLGQIGQVRSSLLRAVRMVVDSGLHAMRWSRERGIRYFLDTMGGQHATAVTEVERYCVIPGQACSYMLGKLEFLAGRERERKALGAAFDIRRYHDKVLLPGAVPLGMLRRF